MFGANRVGVVREDSCGFLAVGGALVTVRVVPCGFSRAPLSLLVQPSETHKTRSLTARSFLPDRPRGTRGHPCQVVAQNGWTPVLLDVLDREFRAAGVADEGRLTRVVHGVGQIADQD